ncbi:MAG: hypothetical protein JW740_00800 [Candidatus Zambryskibacteria bacterium]|nr:hypothetical protein [Candidatus Zambryskibacteria bacterium]
MVRIYQFSPKNADALNFRADSDKLLDDFFKSVMENPGADIFFTIWFYLIYQDIKGDRSMIKKWRKKLKNLNFDQLVVIAQLSTIEEWKNTPSYFLALVEEAYSRNP